MVGTDQKKRTEQKHLIGRAQMTRAVVLIVYLVEQTAHWHTIRGIVQLELWYSLTCRNIGA